MSKTKGDSLVGRWISIEYEDRQSKARWYKGLVRKYDRNSDRYLVRAQPVASARTPPPPARRPPPPRRRAHPPGLPAFSGAGGGR
jgi:hypothetical protein